MRTLDLTGFCVMERTGEDLTAGHHFVGRLSGGNRTRNQILYVTHVQFPERGGIEFSGADGNGLWWWCGVLRAARKFCFELNSPLQNRVYVIIAENGTSLQDWMNAIRRVRSPLPSLSTRLVSPVHSRPPSSQAMLRIRREKSKADSVSRKNKEKTGHLLCSPLPSRHQPHLFPSPRPVLQRKCQVTVE